MLTGIDSDSSRLILTREKTSTFKHDSKKCWHPLWMFSTHRALDYLEQIIHDVIDQPRVHFDRFPLPNSSSISPPDLFPSIGDGRNVDHSIGSSVMRKWVVVHCRGRAARSTDESNFEVHWWKEKERKKETTDHVLFLAHQSSMQQIESKSFQGQICFSDQHVSFIDENHWTSAASDCIAMRNLRESLAKMARSSLRFFSSSVSLSLSRSISSVHEEILRYREWRWTSSQVTLQCFRLPPFVFLPIQHPYLYSLSLNVTHIHSDRKYTFVARLKQDNEVNPTRSSETFFTLLSISLRLVAPNPGKPAPTLAELPPRRFEWFL